jgi:2-polyprenyl-6-methoxyphenol hydroxylase-like FAD-dependent oxidoreductase
MAKPGRVVIVGGGVGGLTLALALQRAGIACEVHEKHAALQRRATGFTLWSYAIRSLLGLGVDAAALAASGGAIECTEIRNQEGKLIESMPVGEVSRSLGAPSYDMRRADFLATLIRHLAPGTVRMGSECLGVEPGGGGARARLAAGSVAEGDLVVGADGIHSVLRDAVAGRAELRYSGFAAVAAVLPFRHELLLPGRHVEIWARGSKGGVADVGKGLARWYVTARLPAGAGAHVEKPAVLEHIRGWYPLLAAAVEATDAAELVHTEAWDLKPLSTWVSGRAVLLGDAAHATTPFAAMGANMTIEDACILADLLGAGGDVDAALAEFQEHRKRRTEDVVRKGRLMGKVSQLHSPFAAWLRDQAFLHMPPDQVEKVTREMASGE